MNQLRSRLLWTATLALLASCYPDSSKVRDGGGAGCVAIGCGGRSCDIACDPRAQTGCAAGAACILFSADEVDCRCQPANRNVAEGGACDTTKLCVPGLICANEAAGNVCRPICRRANPGDCATGRTCNAVSGYSVYGACSPGVTPPPASSNPFGDCDFVTATSCGA